MEVVVIYLLGGLVLLAGFSAIVWLAVEWWKSRRRDRALLASQAKMTQALEKADIHEIKHPKQYREVMSKRIQVYADDPRLLIRAKQARFEVYLEGDTVILAEVILHEHQRPKAAWEQERDETEELNNVKPLQREVEEPLSGRAT